MSRQEKYSLNKSSYKLYIFFLYIFFYHISSLVTYQLQTSEIYFFFLILIALLCYYKVTNVQLEQEKHHLPLYIIRNHFIVVIGFS